MNSNMEKMLEIASQKLGLTSQELKNALDNGNVDDMLKNMRKEDSSRLKSLMASKALREKLMNSSEAAELMKKISKN